jgi:pyruvate carboxylase
MTADGAAAQVQFELNGPIAHGARAGGHVVRIGGVGHGPALGGLAGFVAPEAIVSVAARPGRRVSFGSTLVALEAMKMQTHVTADRDAEVDTVLAAQGDRVQSKEPPVALKGWSGAPGELARAARIHEAWSPPLDHQAGQVTKWRRLERTPSTGHRSG